MEIQLKELIEQIKKEGVEAAEAEAAAIVAKAREQAESIVAEAKEKAAAIVAEAKSESERTVASGEEAIRQAGRNLLISFRESVSRQLSAVLNQQVQKVYTAENLVPLLTDVIRSWAQKPEAEDLSLVLNGEELARLEEALMASLRDQLSQGVTLKPSDSFEGGFRISVNEGSVYYDYSAEAVVDMLSAYLSPKVKALLKEAQ